MSGREEATMEFWHKGVAVLLSEGREEFNFSMKDVEDHGMATSLATAGIFNYDY